MLIHYCDFSSTRMATMAQQAIRRKYSCHNHINTIVNVTTIHWKNNQYIGEAHNKMTNMKYNQQLEFITYTNITMQTPLYDAQTYQYKHRYSSGAVSE